MSEPEYLEKSATFSPCKRYRYTLTRTWDEHRPRLCWCMLNPSTATEHVLDPTVRRCVGFAEAWGYGGITVVNLFALRSTDPTMLLEIDDPVGPANDASLVAASNNHPVVVAAWGVWGRHLNRGQKVLELLRQGQAELKCLGKTKDGYPCHPLYKAARTPLIEV